MKLTMRIFASLLLLFFTNSLAWAQTADDGSFVKKVSNHITTIYLHQLESEASIFNGREYQPDIRLDQGGFTSFMNDQYVKGSIVYDGHNYDNVFIKYDLVRNQVVLLNYDKVGGIMLLPSHVASFSLHEHTFINIGLEEPQAKQLAPGYYDLLYDGKVRLLAKRQKKIAETVTQYKVLRLVDEQNAYYLFKNGTYFSIKGKNALLKVLNDNKAQNKKYIKAKELNFKKNKEDAMIDLVKFYDVTKH